MNVKSKWNKFPISDKIIIVLFLLGLLFLIIGIIILLSVKVNNNLFNGFNLVHNIGIISSLKYYEPDNIVNIIFLKIGIIFTVFLMPIFSGISILWFAIDRLFL